MMIKKIRDMYVDEVPFHEITQELYELVLMLYDDCENGEGLKKMKDNLNNFKDVISSVQDLTFVLNEKARKGITQ